MQSYSYTLEQILLSRLETVSHLFLDQQSKTVQNKEKAITLVLCQTAVQREQRVTSA